MRAERTLTTLALMWLFACEAKTAPPAGPLSLRVSVPAVLKAKDSRDVTVTLTNQSAQPTVILPRMVRLQFEGAGAQYVPFPGPPIDPWDRARILTPGTIETIVFRDTSDGRGFWRLAPGTYGVKAIYEVLVELQPTSNAAPTGVVWRGRLESPKAPLTVEAAD